MEAAATTTPITTTAMATVTPTTIMARRIRASGSAWGWAMAAITADTAGMISTATAAGLPARITALPAAATPASVVALPAVAPVEARRPRAARRPTAPEDCSNKPRKEKGPERTPALPLLALMVGGA